MLGRSAWKRRELFTQSVPILAAIYSVNEAPDALSDYVLRTNSGSFATLTAIRRAL
jgi:DTW domain-containing protein YfiP